MNITGVNQDAVFLKQLKKNYLKLCIKKWGSKLKK